MQQIIKVRELKLIVYFIAKRAGIEDLFTLKWDYLRKVISERCLGTW